MRVRLIGEQAIWQHQSSDTFLERYKITVGTEYDVLKVNKTVRGTSYLIENDEGGPVGPLHAWRFEVVTK